MAEAGLHTLSELPDTGGTMTAVRRFFLFQCLFSPPTPLPPLPTFHPLPPLPPLPPTPAPPAASSSFCSSSGFFFLFILWLSSGFFSQTMDLRMTCRCEDVQYFLIWDIQAFLHMCSIPISWEFIVYCVHLAHLTSAHCLYFFYVC